jgi:hypothetical protein
MCWRKKNLISNSGIVWDVTNVQRQTSALQKNQSCIAHLIFQHKQNQSLDKTDCCCCFFCFVFSFQHVETKTISFKFILRETTCLPVNDMYKYRISEALHFKIKKITTLINQRNYYWKKKTYQVLKTNSNFSFNYILMKMKTTTNGFFTLSINK